MYDGWNMYGGGDWEKMSSSSFNNSYDIVNSIF